MHNPESEKRGRRMSMASGLLRSTSAALSMVKSTHLCLRVALDDAQGQKIHFDLLTCTV